MHTFLQIYQALCFFLLPLLCLQLLAFPLLADIELVQPPCHVEHADIGCIQKASMIACKQLKNKDQKPMPCRNGSKYLLRQPKTLPN